MAHRSVVQTTKSCICSLQGVQTKYKHGLTAFIYRRVKNYTPAAYNTAHRDFVDYRAL